MTARIISLDDLIDIVASLSDEQYRMASQDHTSIGDHVRHTIEYCESFLNGIADKKINYDRRKRCQTLAQNRQAAIDKLHRIQTELATTAHDASPIQVQEAVNAGSASPIADSTIAREYIFIAAHIVHHLAIIKMLAIHLGIPVRQDIGKAASTISYERDNV